MVAQYVETDYYQHRRRLHDSRQNFIHVRHKFPTKQSF